MVESGNLLDHEVTIGAIAALMKEMERNILNLMRKTILPMSIMETYAHSFPIPLPEKVKMESTMNAQHYMGAGRVDNTGKAILYGLLYKVAQISRFNICDVTVRAHGEFG